MTGAKIEARHIGIGQALAQYRLAVPINQREYAWKEEHVEALFQDWLDAITKNKPSYFLGTIVLTTARSGAMEVADGQQRLATTTILLAAIRDYFIAQGEEVLARGLSEFLGTVDLDTRTEVPKLTLNIDDDEFFRKRVLSPPGSAARKMKAGPPSHQNIQNAARKAQEYVEAIIRQFTDSNRKVGALTRWVSFVRDAAQVIVLLVPDDVNAYVMFETLNDRGLKTSQADLLKNYLFGQAGKRLAEVQAKWAQMRGALESIESDEESTLNYLRYYTIAYKGHTHTRDVFAKVKSSISDAGPTVEYVSSLAEAAHDYIAIHMEHHEKWSPYPPGMRRSIRALGMLRAAPLRPIQLAIARHFSPKEAEKAFRLLIRWTVRYLVVGGLRSGSTEEAIAEVAVKITTGEIKTAQDLAGAGKTVPSDKAFEAEFAKHRVTQAALARYYLRALQVKASGTDEPEWEPTEDPVITLEHVMPQSPGEGWFGLGDETHGLYYKRIGNLALLRESKNTRLGNRPFSDKRAVLAASGYSLTAEIGQDTDWGPPEIEARQARLAKLAVKTWPLSI